MVFTRLLHPSLFRTSSAQHTYSLFLLIFLQNSPRIHYTPFPVTVFFIVFPLIEADTVALSTKAIMNVTPPHCEMGK